MRNEDQGESSPKPMAPADKRQSCRSQTVFSVVEHQTSEPSLSPVSRALRAPPTVWSTCPSRRRGAAILAGGFHQPRELDQGGCQDKRYGDSRVYRPQSHVLPPPLLPRVGPLMRLRNRIVASVASRVSKFINANNTNASQPGSELLGPSTFF